MLKSCVWSSAETSFLFDPELFVEPPFEMNEKKPKGCRLGVALPFYSVCSILTMYEYWILFPILLTLDKYYIVVFTGFICPMQLKLICFRLKNVSVIFIVFSFSNIFIILWGLLRNIFSPWKLIEMTIHFNQPGDTGLGWASCITVGAHRNKS